MFRNQREEYLKKLRREAIRCDELRNQARDYELVELPQPQFAGWEIHVTLSESGIRRRDAPQILGILDILEWSGPRFIRSLTTIKTLRKHKYGWSGVKTALTRKQLKDSYVLDQFYYDKEISEKEYNNLSEYYKLFFRYNKYKSERYRWVDRKIYTLNWTHFPTYELEFKVRKSYWTHIKVFDLGAQSDYTRLHDKLWHGSTDIGDLMHAYGYSRRRRDCFISSIQCANKMAVIGLKKAYNGIVREDKYIWDDIEVDILKKCGVYKNKAFGWD